MADSLMKEGQDFWLAFSFMLVVIAAVEVAIMSPEAMQSFEIGAVVPISVHVRRRQMIVWFILPYPADYSSGSHVRAASMIKAMLRKFHMVRTRTKSAAHQVSAQDDVDLATIPMDR